MNAAQQLASLASTKDGTGHSIFGASGSKMFLTCAGSLIPNILAVDNGSEPAAYGTVAHEVSEVWLKSGIKPRHMLGRNRFIDAGDWGYFVVIDEEMMAYVQESVDRCILLPGDHIVETWVDYSRLTPIPNQGGTLDFAAMQPGVAVVIDHKYGKGEIVNATNNTQAMLYALGLLYKWDHKYHFQKFILRIHQPRLNHFDEWEISRDDLLEFAGWAKARMHAAWDLKAARTPKPEACLWCKVKDSCAANAMMQMRLVADATEEAFRAVTVEDVAAFKEELDDEVLPFSAKIYDPLRLDTSQMVKLLPYKTGSEKFWKAMSHELLRRAIAGVDLPGLKVVEGRSHRAFENEKKAARHLIAQGCDPKAVVQEVVCSPSQAEALLRTAGHKRKDLPELLEGLIVKPPGKPTLAPVTDKRQALVDFSAVAWGDSGDTDSDESEEI